MPTIPFSIIGSMVQYDMDRPAEFREVEIVVKKSRFIAIAQPVENTDGIKHLIALTRKNHPHATHVAARRDSW